MAENTKIEWCHSTFNPWRGCTKVSEGCKFCYAETLSGRNRKTLGVWGPAGTRVVASEAMWKEPLKWDRAAKRAGERRRVFCASLSDLFEDWAGVVSNSDGSKADHRGVWEQEVGNPWYDPLTLSSIRVRLGNLIRKTPDLDWLLLTKRPENALDMMVDHMFGVTGDGRPAIPSNVWIGTSVEDQKAADDRIPHLLKIPARVLFLSMEPLLGPVDVTPWLESDADRYARDDRFGIPADANRAKVGWVIVGGESGPGARPMHPVWAMEIRDQCQAAGVPFFFKQWGNWKPHRDMPEAEWKDLYEPTPEPTPQNPEPTAECMVRTTMFPPRPLPVGGPCDLMYDVGKSRAGRLLGGREWNEYPKVRVTS